MQNQSEQPDFVNAGGDYSLFTKDRSDTTTDMNIHQNQPLQACAYMPDGTFAPVNPAWLQTPPFPHIPSPPPQMQQVQQEAQHIAEGDQTAEGSHPDDAQNVLQRAQWVFTPSGHLHLSQLGFFPELSGPHEIFVASLFASPCEARLAGAVYNETIPRIFLSSAGILTALLRYDVRIEMTADKVIRLVNTRHQGVCATNSRGNVNFFHHGAVKMHHDCTKTELAIYPDKRLTMATEGVLFANWQQCFYLNSADGDTINIATPEFTEIQHDYSVEMLTEGQYAAPPPSYDDIIDRSKFYCHPDGSCTILTNGLKIYQDTQGDVTVITGPKFLKTSPGSGAMSLETHFVHIEVDPRWSVYLLRGQHRITSHVCSNNEPIFEVTTRLSVGNGITEGGFDQTGQVFSRNHEKKRANRRRFARTQTGPLSTPREDDAGSSEVPPLELDDVDAISNSSFPVSSPRDAHSLSWS